MARKLVVKRGDKLGAPPGTLLHIGRHKADTAAIQLISYGPDELEERPVADLNQYQRGDGAGQINWLNVDGLADPAVVESMGKLFQLHPLVMEDILNTDQRPKVEEYPGYLYIVLRMLQFDKDRQQIHSEQLSCWARIMCCPFRSVPAMYSTGCANGCGPDGASASCAVTT